MTTTRMSPPTSLKADTHIPIPQTAWLHRLPKRFRLPPLRSLILIGVGVDRDERHFTALLRRRHYCEEVVSIDWGDWQSFYVRYVVRYVPPTVRTEDASLNDDENTATPMRPTPLSDGLTAPAGIVRKLRKITVVEKDSEIDERAEMQCRN